MANTKKNVTDEKIDITAKAAEIKAEAANAVPAEKKGEASKPAKKRGRPASAKTKTEKSSAAMKEKAPDAKAEKAPAPKAEKTAAAKTEKTSVAKSEKAPAAKKESTSKAGKKRGRPAAAKAADNAAAKTTGKRGAAKKSSSAAAPAKRGGRKKAVTYDNVVEAARKKMASANISRIKYPIAVNIKLLGNINGDFYVLISDGKIDVEPYPYNDKDVKMEINDIESFMAVLNGKKDIYDALADGSVSISDNTKKAILFINAAF